MSSKSLRWTWFVSLVAVTGVALVLAFVLSLATRGGTFSPAQLLALQAQIYRLSQDMEITSRVLDRSVGALKSVLSMQV